MLLDLLVQGFLLAFVVGLGVAERRHVFLVELVDALSILLHRRDLVLAGSQAQCFWLVLYFGNVFIFQVLVKTVFNLADGPA